MKRMSNLFSQSLKKIRFAPVFSGRSAARLAHHVRDVGVGCSNHLAPTSPAGAHRATAGFFVSESTSKLLVLLINNAFWMMVYLTLLKMNVLKVAAV